MIWEVIVMYEMYHTAHDTPMDLHLTGLGQPFYKSSKGTGWTKLTYSQLHLSTTVKAGGKDCHGLPDISGDWTHIENGGMRKDPKNPGVSTSVLASL